MISVDILHIHDENLEIICYDQYQYISPAQKPKRIEATTIFSILFCCDKKLQNGRQGLHRPCNYYILFSNGAQNIYRYFGLLSAAIPIRFLHRMDCLAPSQRCYYSSEMLRYHQFQIMPSLLSMSYGTPFFRKFHICRPTVFA